MRLKSLHEIMAFNKELLDIFTDYSFCLDKYFSDTNNQLQHKELFEEYQVLHQNLKRLKEKYKL